MTPGEENDVLGEKVVEQIESENTDKASGPHRYELLTYPADPTLKGLYDQWVAKDIRMAKGQRKYVWSVRQASRLIESFLLGLPVPAVFLYEQREGAVRQVVDGQQRLRSVFFFFEEAFEEEGGRKRVFRLQLDDSSPWNQKKYRDLSEEDRRRLENSVLRTFIMRQLRPDDATSILHVFERLNSGGTILNSQEVRNCVFEGELNDLLTFLNTLPAWREILGRPKPHKRLIDVELVLRFLALWDSWATYTKPMKEFLTDFMNKYRDGRSNDGFRKVFEGTCEAVLKTLGSRPFHIHRGLNAPVYDAVFVAYATNPTKIKGAMKTRYRNLLQDRKFAQSTSKATTDVENVKTRIKTAVKVLFGRS